MASELVIDGKFVLVEDDPGVPVGASLLDPFAGLPEAVYKPWLLEYHAECEKILQERMKSGDYGCLCEQHAAHELEVFETLSVLFPDLSDDPLDEGKVHGTNKAVDSTRVRVRDVETNFNSVFSAAAAKTMKSRATNARKGFNELVDKARNDITEMLGLWRDEQLTFRNLQVDSAQLFRHLYEQVWELGRASSGIHALTPDSYTTDEEKQWFRSALREELGYWQNFLLELRDHYDKDKPLPRFTPAERVEMYLKTFEAIYDSARAFALPSAVLIYWIGPGRNDPTICKGCAYIVERQPFTKSNLPAVPRSGATPCLQNCRHKLVVRKATPAQITARQVALPNRETMVKALAEFTQRKKLRKPRGAGAAHALNPYARGSVEKSRGR